MGVAGLDAELVREDAELVDLKKLIGEIATMSGDVGHHHKPIKVDFKVVNGRGAEPDFQVQGHDLRLGQVFTNLIENARSFVPEKGGRLVITLSRPGDKVIITFDDNGPGIRAEKIDRIFERFYTDRPAGEAFGQNSGLGLSISRQIIEAHGGTLTAENIAGAKPGEVRGARFVVTLPAEG